MSETKTERHSDCGCSKGRLIDTEPTCMEKDSEGIIVCTREPGHDGPHKACSPSEHPIKVWDND